MFCGKKFQNVPNSILLKIFSFLDAESLKNAALVCKDWSDLIGSSVVTMKKFKLKSLASVFPSDTEKDQFLRKHCNVQIMYREDFDGTVKKLEKFDVSQVLHFFISGQSSVDAAKLSMLLKKMPLLERMDFHPFFAVVEGKLEENKVDLLKLKHLHIEPTNCKMLWFFNTQQCEKLQIVGYRPPNGEDLDDIKSFLKRNETLKSLELNESTFKSIFAEVNDLSYKFCLEHFEMHQPSFVGELISTNFNQFLISQSATLKSLNLFGAMNLSLCVYETIFNSLKSLQTLVLNASYLPEDDSFYANINPNESLKNLTFYKNIPSTYAVSGILKNVPNIETLKFHGDLGDEINIVATYNTKLIKLAINILQCALETGLRFEELKYFKVNGIESTKDWLSITTASPLIETLKVEWVDKDKITEAVVDTLLQQTTLRHLSFIGDFEDIEIIFNKIKLNYGNLKTLELEMFNRSEFGTIVSAEVKFEFPDNPTEWKIDDQSCKFNEAWEHRHY